MKKIFIVFFLVLCASVYSAGYEFEYKTLPNKVECNFKFDIHNQTENNTIGRSNLIEIKAQKQDNKYIASCIDTSLESKNTEFQFTLNIDKENLQVDISDDIFVFPYIEFSKDFLSSQFILPRHIVNVGDVWYTKIKNPFANKDLYIECRLVRVADNIATVYFTVKSPFGFIPVETEKELMDIKIRDGSTFYFYVDKLYGNGEVTGSGLWKFDLEKGALISSNHFYKITSLMRRDDKTDIVSTKDFIYVDVNMDFKYNFVY